MSEPGRSPDSGKSGSRSGWECTWPCTSGFSISTANNWDPLCTASPVTLPYQNNKPRPLRLTLLSPTTPIPSLITATPHSFSDMPQIYSPKPQHAPTPSDRPTTPNRPPSRSEKLLREALMKDEQERNPLPINPTLARSPVRNHQRRHSHIPRTSPEDHRAEDLTRGNFLFRSAMLSNSGPRSPSPSLLDNNSSLSRRHSHSRQHHQSDMQLRHEDAASSSHYTQSPTSASRTHSPSRGHSPVTRRSSVKSQHHAYPSPRAASPHSRAYAPNSPSSYAPSVASSQQSPTLSRRHVPRPLPLSPGPEPTTEGLPMTPHEQVLRARLERVLHTTRSPSAKTDGRRKREGTDWMIGVGDDETVPSTDSDENVVRDENGGWAWGGHNSSNNSKKNGGGGVMAVTPPSSGSNSARSGSREDMLLHQASASSRQHHQRSRSRTEPAPVLAGSMTSPGAHPSPKRTATAPSSLPHYHQPGSYHHHHQYHPRGGRSGTTPPLVSDGSPTPEEEEEEEDPEDVRLLTPPPTPPTQMSGAYHHYTVSPGKEYMPSPYKTSFDARRSGPPLTMLKNDRRGLSMGHGGGSAYSDDEDDGDDDPDYEDDAESCSCSGCSGSGSCSRLSSGRRGAMQHYGALTNNGGVNGPVSSRPQQFNVRRASARCRQMDGYVSFAAIEGLGMPPDVDGDESEERRKAEMNGKRDGGGVTDWVRWTKKRLLGGGNEQEEDKRRHQQQQQQQQSLVL